jgi:hypothetical protein
MKERKTMKGRVERQDERERKRDIEILIGRYRKTE